MPRQALSRLHNFQMDVETDSTALRPRAREGDWSHPPLSSEQRELRTARPDEESLARPVLGCGGTISDLAD